MNFTIRVFYRQQGTYNILETVDVIPCRVSIITDIKPVKNKQTGELSLTYDVSKAYLKANDKGYLTLYIQK